MNDCAVQGAQDAQPAERHIPFLAWLGAKRERVADGEAVVAERIAAMRGANAI